ncbi:unnamed protein product, partial [Adineta steineri]
EQLNMYQNLWHTPNELTNCLNCGALLPFDRYSIEHNEKFVEMITENEANKRKLQQIQLKLEKTEAKEQETLAKLQKTLVITEQCQFEKAEAVVERDQIQHELTETQKRLKLLINEISEKVTNETQSIEIICQQQLKDNIEKTKKIEDKCTQYELIIDRLTREKTSLAADLDVWKERIQRQEMDLSQDVLQLRHQLGSTQNRCNDIESELLDSKKQCLDLTEEINRLTRENTMLKSVKQTLERSREENIDTVMIMLNKCEVDYRTTIENLELERQQSLSHLEDLVHHQNIILSKLRAYSRQLTNEIEKILQRKNEIVQVITIENQELRMKLSNAYERLEQNDTQLLQHSDTH